VRTKRFCRNRLAETSTRMGKESTSFPEIDRINWEKKGRVALVEKVFFMWDRGGKVEGDIKARNHSGGGGVFF